MPRAPDQVIIAGAWRTILDELGYDPEAPHLRDSPSRVARFLAGWHTTRGEPPSLTNFKNDDPTYDEVVLADGLSFHSMCAHHGLPFFGTAAVAYIPGKKLVGLSKLARVVDHFSHRFQTQEGITHNVAEHLMKELEPVGVGVVLRAEHLCMSMRGVAKPGHRTTTSIMLGSFLTKPEARAELMAMIGGRA